MTPERKMQMKRTKEMKIRFTDDELKKLTADAGKSGLSRESYCRKVLGGAEIREAPPVDVPVLIREVRRVGGNLNQILRTANSIGLVDAPELRKTLDELHSVDRLITDAYTTRSS